MRWMLAVLAVLALVCLPRLSHAETLAGFVTAVQPSGAFEVNGVHITFGPKVRICSHIGDPAAPPAENCDNPLDPATAPFYVGASINATGHLDHAAHTLTASRIDLILPPVATIQGTAIIDLVPSAQLVNSKERIVRADGYLLHITPDTKLTLKPPLKSLSDISTNQWIQYSGVQQADGAVTVNSASITPNKVSGTEDKLRKKTEYDPAKVPGDAHQSGLSKAFTGTDYKRVPPWHDDAMQARVERIGNSLVPAYQRALPDGDPAKINFRFQVIDQKKGRDAIYLSSGVIVVPYQVVDRMQNDDQLATVLADNIAENLEKDTLHMVSVGAKVGAADIAGDVAGVFVPGLGLATVLTGSGVAAHQYALELQQSGRVSLCLLHDAGYNIDQAPLAWWLLAAKPGKPLNETKIPHRTATLYTMLGTTWHTSAVTNSAPSLAPPTTTANNAALPPSKN